MSASQAAVISSNASICVHTVAAHVVTLYEAGRRQMTFGHETLKSTHTTLLINTDFVHELEDGKRARVPYARRKPTKQLRKHRGLKKKNCCLVRPTGICCALLLFQLHKAGQNVKRRR